VFLAHQGTDARHRLEAEQGNRFLCCDRWFVVIGHAAPFDGCSPQPVAVVATR
jgi:hypothetical protein